MGVHVWALDELLSLMPKWTDGSPRYMIKIDEQEDDYRAVIKYCRSQSDLNPNKVILWGTTFSGTHGYSGIACVLVLRIGPGGHVVKLASEVSALACELFMHSKGHVLSLSSISRR